MAHAVKLRESGQKAQLDTDLHVILGESADPDGGVPDGALLRRFTVAVLGDEADLEAARRDLLAKLGPSRVARAAAIIAGFDAINRVADATGMRLNAETEDLSRDLVADLELEPMRSV